tara:strand:- start:78 stop:1988 length:1911 start_codon:yes stop_codon:yes gene_type:complete
MSREKQLERLVVTLEAKTAKYQADLAKANSKSKQFAKDTKKHAIDIKGALAGIGFAFATKKIIDATAKQEKAVKQLEQGLKSTANTAGFSLQELTKYASELQKVTTFGDEDIIAAQAQLVTFTRITGDEFKNTMKAALDLSTRMDQDLKSSVLQLGKALNDPIGNMGALSRSGIQFTDQQKDMIKSLVKSGDLIGAQRIILKELETQYGGSAEAARLTFGGALEALDNAFGDLLESKDGLEEARKSVEGLTSLLSDPDVVSGVNILTSAIVGGFSGALKAVTDTVNVLKFVGEEFAAFVNGPAVGDTVRIWDALADVRNEIYEIENMGWSNAATDARLDRLKTELKLLEDKLGLSEALMTIEISAGKKTPGPDPISETPDQKEKKKKYSFISDPDQLKTFSNLMDEYGVVAANAAEYIEDSFVNAFSNMHDSLSQGLAQAIVEGESLKDVFGQVAKTLAVDMVASLIKVGTTMMLNAALGDTAQAASTVTGLASANALSAAWAPTAAFVSLASFGANAAPAQLGISTTVGLSSSLAMVGMAHDGISEVPREGTWLLDKGERVLSARQNQDFKDYMQGGGGNGGVNVTNVFQISAGVEGTVRSEIEKLVPAIERLSRNSVEKAIRGGGSLARAVGAR